MSARRSRGPRLFDVTSRVELDAIETRENGYEPGERVAYTDPLGVERFGRLVRIFGAWARIVPEHLNHPVTIGKGCIRKV